MISADCVIANSDVVYTYHQLIDARFRNADFDQLYRQSKRTATNAERIPIYEKMSRLVAAYSPWGLRVYAIRNALVHNWVQGYRRNPHFLQVWRFVDIDIAKQMAR